MLVFIFFFKYIILVIGVLLAVALLTLYERKLLGAVQRRKGPNVVGFWGLLQPFLDALKLLLKETVIPFLVNKFLFILAPIVSFLLSLMTWIVVPFMHGHVLSDINIGILYVFAISSLSVYGIIISGWSSNSRYAFLGAIRSSAQMIAYEVSIGLILLTIIIVVGSLNLSQIVIFQSKSIWFSILFIPSLILFLVSMLAETNRPPFDLPEAEAELVSGYNVEYSAVGFALFFIAEYANIIFMSTFCVILFFGGWHFFGLEYFLFGFLGCLIFSLKIMGMLVFFILVRAVLPRYRYDQLMYSGWKVFLPFSFSYFFFFSIIIYICNGLWFF